MKTARKFPSTCYTLINQLENTETNIRNELILTANQTLNNFPVISMSGFYIINKFTLSVIFSTIATYTIVVVQIEMAFNE